MRKLLLLRPRERRLALIAGVVIGSWILVAGLAQPLWDRSQALRLQVEAKKEKVSALRRVLAQAGTVERAYQGISPYLAGEPHDEEQASSAFLSALEARSRNTNLKLNLKPKPMKREERLSRFEVEVDVEGSQQDVLAFLDAIFSMPDLIAIERIRIAGIPANAQALRANLVIQRLLLHPDTTKKP